MTMGIYEFDEEKINKALILPKGKVNFSKSISLLDFPGLGLNVDNFGEEFNTWSMQLNFAIKNQFENKSDWVSNAMKALVDKENDWMKYLNENGTFPMNKESILDFTEDLEQNFEFFLKSYISTFRIPKDLKTHPSWDTLAEEMFSQIKSTGVDSDSDLKLILDCSFQEHNKWTKLFEQSKIGCKYFQPILTSNGICHTFNGQNTSTIWKSSRISELFESIFEENEEIMRNDFSYRGTGPIEGEIMNTIKALIISADIMKKIPFLVQIFLEGEDY